MARQRKRDPILPQGPLDRWRRRVERLAPVPGTGASPEGPFLRRMWQRRRIGLVPVVATVLLGWATYSLVAGEHGLLAIAALERDRDRLHGEIAAIEAQIAALSERLGDDSRNAYVLEKTARETYGLARSGEVVYRFDADAFVPRGERDEPLAAGPRIGGHSDRRAP